MSGNLRERSATDTPQPILPKEDNQLERFRKLDALLERRPIRTTNHQPLLEQSSAPVKKLSAAKLSEQEELEQKLRLFMKKANQLDVQGPQGSKSVPKQSTTQKTPAKFDIKKLKVSIDLRPEIRSKLETSLAKTPTDQTPSAPQSAHPVSFARQYFSSSSSPVASTVKAQPKVQNLNNNDIGQLPLNSTWQVLYDRRGLSKDSSGGHRGSRSDVHDWEANLFTLCEMDSVQTFWQYYNHLKPLSQLEATANFHVFRKGIKPMWEDPANRHGGKWNVTFPANFDIREVEQAWLRCLVMMVGESLDSDSQICGSVFSKRSKGDRIAIWLADKEDIDSVLDLGARWFKLSGMSNMTGVELEFQPHDKAHSNATRGSSSGRVKVSQHNSSDLNMNTVREYLKSMK